MASPWPLAFAVGALIVVAVFWAVITTPGDLQQRDLYPSLFLDRVVEHSVYPLWSPRETLSIAGTGRLPITLALVGVAKALGLDGATYARLIVLWIAGVGYVSAFTAFALFARWRTETPRTCAAIGAMVAAVALVVNLWTIARLEHSWLLAQWAAAPLVLGLYLEGTRTTQRRWIIGSALVFALLGAAQPHYLVFTTLMIAAWVVGTMVQCPVKRRRALTDGFVWVAALVPLLAYQIAPFVAVKLYGGSPDPAYTLMDQTRTVLSRHQDLPTTLQGAANANWHELLVPSGASRLPWEFAGWAVALLPLAAVLLRRWGPPALYLAVGGYAAALVAAASNWSLTADLYQTAVNAVPGLWVFREPDRVVGLLIMAQAFGAGFVVADLLSRVGGSGWTRSALGPALLAGYAVLALGVHAVPAVPLLWSTDQPGYVPRPLPADYRDVLRAADAAAGPEGRTLVVSSDDRPAPWDPARTLRLMEAASLANPSLTGDTRSPAPPSPVPGRWIEYIYGVEPAEALAAVQRAGFSHVVVMRDQPAGDELAEALAARPDAAVLASVPNAMAFNLGAAAPLLESSSAVWSDRLDSTAPSGATRILANHRVRPSLPESASPAQPTTDAIFAVAESVELLPVTGWFGFHGSQGGWTRGGAYADERQSWLKRLGREDLHDWASDYGLGLAFAKPGGEREALRIQVPDDRDRAVWLRVFTSPRSTWIDVSTDNTSARLTTTAPTTGWRWLRVGAAADGDIGVTAGPGLEAVSTLALAPTAWRPTAAQASPALVQPQLEVSTREPTRIEATARGAGGWAFIVLRRAYDPTWLAWVDGEAFAPLLADGLWNGYFVPVSEGSAITFEYAPQRWYDLGIAMAAVAAGGMIASLAVTCVDFSRCCSWFRRSGPRPTNR